MSGHSKFANIKHKKEKNDAAKGKIFTKIGKEIAVAVKEGGSSDPSNNSRLRDVIAKAKSNNMPNDTIERNIKRASGDMSAANYEHITYEGYGPNGTAIIVETLTDNKNRTASNVKNAFTKGSGNVGTPGCVSFMFDKKGQIVIDKEEYEGDADELMMQVLDAGAEDFVEEEDSFEVLTDPDDFSAVRLAMEEAGVKPEEVDYINAHGTSTHHNDLFETRAIKLALGEAAKSVKINSTKSMIGHLLGAAGGVEFITCVKSIQDNYIHQTIGLENEGEECDLNYMKVSGEKCTVKVALSNSLGFGGHNGTLAVKKYEK